MYLLASFIHPICQSSFLFHIASGVWKISHKKLNNFQANVAVPKFYTLYDQWFSDWPLMLALPFTSLRLIFYSLFLSIYSPSFFFSVLFLPVSIFLILFSLSLAPYSPAVPLVPQHFLLSLICSFLFFLLPLPSLSFLQFPLFLALSILSRRVSHGIIQKYWFL